jgi:flavin-dependent dehydrogenase
MIDVLVAGGGPAGLATALHAARAGLETMVIERRRGPIDKACGEGLMPHTLKQLAKLDIRLRGREFNGITYLDGQHRAEALFKSVPGLGVRRTVLHMALLQAASEAGVRQVQSNMGRIEQSENTVRCGAFEARYLAAADGLHSPIRRALGLAESGAAARRWGIRRHYLTAPWSDQVEVHWSRGSEAYVTPVAHDCVGIAILTSRRGAFDDCLSEFPALKDRVSGVPHGVDRAAGPLYQAVQKRSAGRVLLVGDAAGYIDALTGEGLGVALSGAELLIECVKADRPDTYDRQWRRMSRRYRLMTEGLLRASRTRWLRPAIVPAASALPAAFTGAVNLLAY